MSPRTDVPSRALVDAKDAECSDVLREIIIGLLTEIKQDPEAKRWVREDEIMRLMLDRHGLAPDESKRFSGSYQAALRTVCPHSMRIVSGENIGSILNETYAAMTFGGIVGLRWPKTELRLCFSELSEMIHFRLLLPPMEVIER